MSTFGHSVTKLTQNTSVVAVHGMDGDCVKSWTHTPKVGASTMWLKDLLPEKLPGCHVMTFQYDATNVGNMSGHGVRENAENLVRFLRNKREDQVGVAVIVALPLQYADSKTGSRGQTDGIRRPQPWRYHHQAGKTFRPLYHSRCHWAVSHRSTTR